MPKLISIVIPVYNAKSHLGQCVRSVLDQTYSDLEAILVDDGSKDGSAEICDAFQRGDSRVKVIHKNNAGPGAARKDGVGAATGDYIGFVDADDYVDQSMYETLLRVAGEGVDIVQCGFRRVSITGEVLETIELKQLDITGSFQSALYYASQANTTNYLWNKLYRTALFESVVFPSLYAGEDSCVLSQAYAFAERVVSIKQPLYNYVMTPDSLCRQPFSEKKLDNIDAGKFMYDFYLKRFPEISGFAALHTCSYAAKLYCEMLGGTEMKQSRMADLLCDFSTYYELSKDKMVRRRTSKRRVWFVELFRISPRICSLAYGLWMGQRESRMLAARSDAPMTNGGLEKGH